MRILYINHARFPTEKAHGHQIAQVCAALAALGHDVTLVVPTVGKPMATDPFTYYGVSPSFRIERLPQFDALHSWFVPEVLALMVSMFSYRRQLGSFFRMHSVDLVYLRSSLVLSAALASGCPVVLELHELPRWGVQRFIRRCNRCARVVCLTFPMRDALVALGADPARIVVEGDAVDLRRFSSLPPASVAKELWRLPLDQPVIGYCGSLVTRETLEKGVPELLRTFAMLKKRGVPFQGWIVGGPARWVERDRTLAAELGIASSVRFEGPVPASDVPAVLAACDVLVYPAPASTHPYFVRDTSPLKLFEYLAAGNPVVAADLPPVRDLLSEREATFCRPGNPASLADAIASVLAHPAEAAAKAENGKALVARHSWEERMRRILGGLFENVVNE